VRADYLFISKSFSFPYSVGAWVNFKNRGNDTNHFVLHVGAIDKVRYAIALIYQVEPLSEICFYFRTGKLKFNDNRQIFGDRYDFFISIKNNPGGEFF